MKFSGVTILRDVEFSIILYILIFAWVRVCVIVAWWRNHVEQAIYTSVALSSSSIYFGTGLRAVIPTFGKVREIIVKVKCLAKVISNVRLLPVI